MKTTTISFRVSEELKQALIDLAKAESDKTGYDISVNQLGIKALESFLFSSQSCPKNI